MGEEGEGVAARPGGRLARVGSLVARRPRRVLAVWLAAVVGLASIGIGLEDELSTQAIYVDGTQSAEEHRIATREFGSENAVVVMLRGPAGRVEAQGRRLEAEIQSIRGAVVLSPWAAGGSIEGLRPRPGVAAMVVNVRARRGEGLLEILPIVREHVAETVREPVRASIAGAPAIVESIQDSTFHAAEVGQWIAIPALLIVLLLVFRSVLAAAIPVVVGGSVVVATRGVLDLLTGVFELEVIALGAAGMMGLALGVDYALLVVSRFREEVGRGRSVPEAIETTVEVTGRTVLMAGSGLTLAMLVAVQFLSGTIVTSVALAVIGCSVLSVLGAICVVPAMLVVLGTNLDRWALPRRSGAGWAASLSARLARRRMVALPLVFVLVFATVWAMALDTGIATVALLPEDDPGRRQQEAVQRELGPGWIAPYEIVMADSDGPVTTPERLQALADFQRRLERDPGVETMTGYAGIARASRQLSGIDRTLAAQERGLDRLGRGLVKVHRGARLNTGGLRQAAEGATRLGTALTATENGAGALADGLGAAGSGSTRLIGGLGKASDGSGELADGAASASEGAGRLADGLERAREQAGEIEHNAASLEEAMQAGEQRLTEEVDAPVGAVEERLGAAREALGQMGVGRTDPRYSAALEAVEEAMVWLTGLDPRTGEESPTTTGVVGGVTRARSQFGLGLYLSQRLAKNGESAAEGMAKLAKGSTKLDSGLEKLRSGSNELSDGIARLSRRGEALPPGLGSLREGAERLALGLGQMETGAGTLSDGLGGGAERSELLGGALDEMRQGLARSGDSGLDRLDRRSPGLFDSGYFFLASLDGSRSERRRQASFLISVENGGSAARMLVIPRHEPSDPRAAETRDRLEARAGELAERTGAEVAVGGPTPLQLDVDAAYRDQAPMTRLALALVTMAILILVVRSLLVPFIAAILNLVTVAATFGFLALLFDGSLLGGPGYVDTGVIPATIMVIFGLAIDYEVFVFSRMREEYLRTGSPEAAVTNGLAQTAPVVTGAAIIMIVVFLSFAVSSFATMRNFGVAQAIGVAIDAFAIRLIVVPVMMRALGRWAWWMPGWLDRLLPGTPNSAAAAAGGLR